MEVIGTIYKKCITEEKATKNGTMQKRVLVLMQKTYDKHTGEERINYPALEFSGTKCAELDNFSLGQRVKVHFDLSGSLYKDKNTGEEKNFTAIRAYRVEEYVQKVGPFKDAAPKAPAAPQATAQQQYTGNEFFDGMAPASGGPF